VSRQTASPDKPFLKAKTLAAAVLASAPFDHNIGSASAMLGFPQIDVSSIASASIGVFESHSLLPVVLILAPTSWAGLAILVVGRRRLFQSRFVSTHTGSIA
jgi:hypothetical protein